MKQMSRLVRPTLHIEAIADKGSDNRVLECAVAGQVDAIVTGDRKHLLPLRRYAGIPILSPTAFLEAWQQKTTRGSELRVTTLGTRFPSAQALIFGRRGVSVSVLGTAAEPGAWGG
jgi:hypothetical protein